MSTEEIIRILYKRLAGGRLTPGESAMLEEWIAVNPEQRREMADALSDPAHLADEWRVRSMIDCERPMREMQQRLCMAESRDEGDNPEECENYGYLQTEMQNALRRRRAIRWTAAACALLLAGAGAFFLMNRNPVAPAATHTATATIEPLRLENLTPGASQAIVTTPAGDTIHLSGSAGSRSMLAAAAAQGPLQIDVPRGGEFVVTLEDSTRVWLNSESRLIYPTHFTAQCRRVQVSGEAYFDVTHNADSPFIVESGNQVVKVYGTEFNIRAYPEDDAIYTTLAEGKISLASRNGGGEIFLFPGRQAIYDKKADSASIRNIDIERVSSWRHGRFVFEEQSLRQIMCDLSRWYDFEYEFADSDAAEKIFMGSIPRYSNFKTAIAILEKSGGLTIDIKDNKVRISSRKN